MSQNAGYETSIADPWSGLISRVFIKVEGFYLDQYAGFSIGDFGRG